MARTHDCVLTVFSRISKGRKRLRLYVSITRASGHSFHRLSVDDTDCQTAFAAHAPFAMRKPRGPAPSPSCERVRMAFTSCAIWREVSLSRSDSVMRSVMCPPHFSISDHALGESMPCSLSLSTAHCLSSPSASSNASCTMEERIASRPQEDRATGDARPGKWPPQFCLVGEREEAGRYIDFRDSRLESEGGSGSTFAELALNKDFPDSCRLSIDSFRERGSWLEESRVEGRIAAHPPCMPPSVRGRAPRT